MALGIGQWYDITELPRGYTLEQVVDLAKAKGATTVRLYAKYGMQPINYTVLETTLNMLKAKNMKVIFCPFMNWKDHAQYFGSADWITKWKELANRYKNDDRIWLFELFNEPNPPTWSPTITGPEDVHTALAACIDAIRATGDNHTILLPDHMVYNDWVWHFKAGTERSNCVQGVHFWASLWAQTTYGTGKAFWEQWCLARITKFKAAYPNYPILFGENGIEYPPAGFGTLDFQLEAQINAINWCIANNVDFTWHLFGWNYQVGDFYEGKFDWVMPQTNWKLEPVSPSPQQAGFPIVPVIVVTVFLGGWWLLSRKKRKR